MTKKIAIATIFVSAALGLTLCLGLTTTQSVAAQAAPTATIQSMINAAPDGGTVNIAAGTYTESLTVNKTLTLTGATSATTIIQAVSGQRVITVTAGHNLRLENVTLMGGQASGSGGGGVYAMGGNLQIVNCRIANNSAQFGGGVFQEGSSGRVDVIGSRIELNSSGSQGGGLFVRGSAALTNTLVLSNTSGLYGGGLHVDSGRADLIGGLFQNNVAAGSNGGAVNLNNSISISGTQFISNMANDQGGALLQWNTGYTVTVIKARFERNTAKSKGGAASINGTLLISNSMFMTNTADSGNTTNTYGGGVSAGGVTQILASTFVSNSARCTSCSYMYGGGLYAVQPVTIQDSTFEKNNAWLGGGVYGNNAAITVTSSTFSNNSGGYGGAIDALTVQATGSDFVGNRVVNNGGALMAPVIMLSGGQFISNTASYGGGVWAGTRLDVVNTLFNGNRAGRGGAVNGDSTITLTGAQFISNTASSSGGALYQPNAGYTVTVISTRFERNTAKSTGGGASISGTLLISNSTFVSNTVDSGNGSSTFGGGLYAGGPNQISASTFVGNSALCLNGGSCSAANGGGLYDNGGNVALTDVVFQGNEAGRMGGGLHSENSSPVLSRVILRGNKAGWGGGFSHRIGSPWLVNVLFSGNMGGWAGGMLAESDTPTLKHVTFSGNNGYNQGGALLNYYAAPTVVNSIMWGNTAMNGPEIYNASPTPVITITYSDIKFTGVYTGVGNINVDPKFMAPFTATVAPTTSGNYRLTTNSPAVNAGTYLGVVADLDGTLRDSAPDMGAYEIRTCWARLNDTATDYGSVQAAIDASAQTTDVVKVAGYCPGVQPRGGVIQTAYISKSLIMRGGYTTTDWLISNPIGHPTVLDARQAGRVVSIYNAPSTLVNEDVPAAFDKTAIAQPNHSMMPQVPSAITTVSLENLIVQGGLINGAGGGIYDGGAQVTLANTIVRDNSATGNLGGGGICVASLGVLTVTNSLLTGNTASYGGGIYNASARLVLVNSTLSGNQSTTGNPIYDGGGAIDQWGTSPSAIIVNSTIVSNTAVITNVSRSGIWLESGTLNIQNSIVAGNSVTNNVKVNGGTFTSLGYNLTNTDFGTPFTATTDLTNTNPLLGALQDNGGSTWTHALQAGSPAIDRIPFGVNGCGTTVIVDQRGQPRPGTFTDQCDIGAYEAQGIYYHVYLPVVIK